MGSEIEHMYERTLSSHTCEDTVLSYMRIDELGTLTNMMDAAIIMFTAL